MSSTSVDTQQQHVASTESLTQRKSKHHRTKTEDIEVVPQYCQERFILSGYRLNLTVKEALMSLFSLHNETMYV
jgi:hypothetical protein